MKDVLFLAVVSTLIAYTVHLRNYTDLLHRDQNDIFDRIRAWRKNGCDGDAAYWLLSDTAGIIGRRMGYNHATVQRSVQRATDSEDQD